jgi:hypothetical protein
MASSSSPSSEVEKVRTMDSSETSLPPPLVNLPRTGESEAIVLRTYRLGANRPQPNANRQNSVSNGALKPEFPNIVYEIFKEDLSKRVQARRFLWEFFD